jgi:hypothetical protein
VCSTVRVSRGVLFVRFPLGLRGPGCATQRERTERTGHKRADSPDSELSTQTPNTQERSNESGYTCIPLLRVCRLSPRVSLEANSETAGHRLAAVFPSSDFMHTVHSRRSAMVHPSDGGNTTGNMPSRRLTTPSYLPPLSPVCHPPCLVPPCAPFLSGPGPGPLYLVCCAVL